MRRIGERCYEIEKQKMEVLKNIKQELTEKDYISIRERWDKEDELLNSRTGTFLTANTILFAAAQFQKESLYSLGIAIVGIIVTIFWLLVSSRSARIIAYFYGICQEIMPKYMKFIYSYKKPRLTPTKIITKVLPLIILISWLTFIVYYYVGS